MKTLIGALFLVFLVSACAASPIAQQSPSAQPSSTATPSASPTPTPTPTPSPTPTVAPSPTPPAGFVAADFSGGSVSDSPVTAVRVGQHDGYDRIVIEFGGGVPSYTVTRQSTATFTRSPRGDQITLQGTAGVLIVIHSVTNWTTYTGPTGFRSGYPFMREALQVENYEGYQQWALGIQGTPYLRVFTMSSPSRLVVDVAAL
jgi:hypothetical protein